MFWLGRREGQELGEQIGIKKGEQIGIKKGEQIGIKKGEQIGIKKGEQIGLEKGREEREHNAKLLIARNLLNSGMSKERVTVITGLQLEDLHSL